MPRHLNHLSNPINSFLASRFSTPVKHRIAYRNGNLEMPPPLNISFIQGEAFLQLHFFETLREKQITNPENQNLYWQHLLEEKKYIRQLVEHSSIKDYFRLDENSSAEQEYKKLCYAAFCIVLWDMQVNDNRALAVRTVKGYINHFLPQLFPKQNKSKDADTVKKDIAALLYKKWGVRPQITESFQTNDDSVTYTLIARIDKHSPVTLLSMQGKRLKPTRLKTCIKALELLEMQSLIVETPQAVLPNKKQKVVPIGKN